MKKDPTLLTNYDYTGFFLHFLVDKQLSGDRQLYPVQPCPEYLLVFVYSGELAVTCKKCTTTIGKGEYIFLCKDKEITLTPKNQEREPFKSVCMGFNRLFLNEFHGQMNISKIPRNTGCFTHPIIPLAQSPHFDSLYISMLPYLQQQLTPICQILELKLKEAVYGLLLTDKRFYSCLFPTMLATDGKKEVIYRDYTHRKQIQDVYLITTAGEAEIKAVEGTVTSFRGFPGYLDNIRVAGLILGNGVYEPGEVRNNPGMQQA